MSKYYDDAAKREGWALFECDNGKLQIQRLDTPQDAFPDLPFEPMWESGGDAIAHVEERANTGSEMHKAALALHGTWA